MQDSQPLHLAPGGSGQVEGSDRPKWPGTRLPEAPGKQPPRPPPILWMLWALVGCLTGPCAPGPLEGWAGTGPQEQFIFSGFFQLGMCQASRVHHPTGDVSGASKPKSPLAVVCVCVWLPPPPPWGGRTPPGICVSVDCWRGSPRLGRRLRWVMGVSVFTRSWCGVECRGPVPPMFTCVSGSGVPARPHPQASVSTRRRCWAWRPPAPHAPHCCPQPVPWRQAVAVRPPPSTPRRDGCTIFLIHQSVPPPPAFALVLVTYLSGFWEAPLRLSSGGLTDVFQKMVILYDLSWNLF